jgi:hypothetical protein
MTHKNDNLHEASQDKSQTATVDSVEKLAKIVDRLDKDFNNRRTWWKSLSYGLLYGVGTAIGATVLFVLIFYLLMAFESNPIFGGTVSKIIDQFFVGQEI